MAVKPRIFISAVSSELRSTRQLVANVLQRLGYDPVWQEIFGTEPGDLRQALRDKIDDCEGLIQLVGHGYGAEPPQPDAALGRVSYTQFEFLYAQQQRKKTWVVFAEAGCTHDRPPEQLDLPQDPAHPDPAGYQAERRALQEAWRQRLRDEGHLRHAADSDTELELKVERLKDEFKLLGRRFRRWQKMVLAIGAVLIVLLIGVLARQGWLKRDTQEIKQAADEAQKETTATLAEIQAGQKVTAARIRVHLLEASERARDEELAAAEKEPRFDERERLRELAESAHAARLSRIDDLAASFAEIEGRSDVTDEFREMLRILQEEHEDPVDKALAYAEQRRSTRLDRVRARKLAEQERNRAELQIDLKAASLEATRGRPAAARQLFTELLELEPDWPEALDTFAWFLFDQSIQSEFHGTLRDAVADAQRCHDLASRLHSLDETKHESQRLLSAASNQVSDVLVKRGQSGDAEQAFLHYTRSLELAEIMLKQNPDSTEAARDVSVSLNRLGEFLAERGQPGDAEQAFTYYTRDLEISERLLEQNADSAQAARDVMVSYYKISEFEVGNHRFEEAIGQFQKGIAILDGMISKRLYEAQSRQEKDFLAERVQFCEEMVIVTSDWETFLKTDEELLPSLLTRRATELAKQNRLADVEQAGAKLRELEPRTNNNLYNAACAYALCATLVVKDKPAPTEAEQAEWKRFIDLSLICLKKAIAAGFDDFEHMQQDDDLTPLRDLPEFQALAPPTSPQALEPTE